MQLKKKEKTKSPPIEQRLKTAIGKNIEVAIDDLGDTIKETDKQIASRLGVTPVHLTRLKAGKVESIRKVIAISELTGRKLKWFFETENDRREERETINKLKEEIKKLNNDKLLLKELLAGKKEK